MPAGLWLALDLTVCKSCQINTFSACLWYLSNWNSICRLCRQPRNWMTTRVNFFPFSGRTNFSYAAPAATALLCLLVISPESLICSFPNLFLNCWHKSEWSRKPRQASVSVACRATALTKKVPVFSQALTRRGRPRRNHFDDAFVNKKRKKREMQEFSGFSSLFLLQCASVEAQDDWSRKRESVVRVPIAQI